MSHSLQIAANPSPPAPRTATSSSVSASRPITARYRATLSVATLPIPRDSRPENFWRLGKSCAEDPPLQRQLGSAGYAPPHPVYLTLALRAAARTIVSFALFRANALISMLFDTMDICD